jgi:hypothetical protein
VYTQLVAETLIDRHRNMAALQDLRSIASENDWFSSGDQDSFRYTQ